MLFVAAGVTDTKVRHSTGVATTNSKKNQKYKSVELGDQCTWLVVLVAVVVVVQGVFV